MFKTLHFHSGKQRFDPWSGKFRMPRSKTTKHYNRKIKSYYLSQTIGWKTASQITLRNCSREAWFSAQFFVLLGQRTSNKSARHSFKIEKKTPTDQQEHSDSWPCAWEGSLSIERVTNSGIPEGGIQSLLLTCTFFTLPR